MGSKYSYILINSYLNCCIVFIHGNLILNAMLNFLISIVGYDFILILITIWINLINSLTHVFVNKNHPFKSLFLAIIHSLFISVQVHDHSNVKVVEIIALS